MKKRFELCDGSGQHSGWHDITEIHNRVCEEFRATIEAYYMSLGVLQAKLCPICCRVFVQNSESLSS